MSNDEYIAFEERLMLLLHGSAAFQYVNAGIKLKIFCYYLDHERATFAELRSSSELSGDALECLLFGLTSLKLLRRNNRGEYLLSKGMVALVKSDFWQVFESMVEFQSEIAYMGQGKFVEALRKNSNVGLEYIAGSGSTLYEKFQSNDRIKSVFYRYMELYSKYAAKHLLERVSFRDDKRILDVGGGRGGASILLAKENEESEFVVTDLKFMEFEINEEVKKCGLEERISFEPLDILNDTFPSEFDSVLFFHQLVIWAKPQVEKLLIKAFRALRPGGRVIIFSSMANQEYSGPLMASLDSVYFKAIAAGNGMIYSWKEYFLILEKIGFSDLERIDCLGWTPHQIVVAHKK